MYVFGYVVQFFDDKVIFCIGSGNMLVDLLCFCGEGDIVVVVMFDLYICEVIEVMQYVYVCGVCFVYVIDSVIVLGVELVWQQFVVFVVILLFFYLLVVFMVLFDVLLMMWFCYVGLIVFVYFVDSDVQFK